MCFSKIASFNINNVGRSLKYAQVLKFSRTLSHNTLFVCRCHGEQVEISTGASPGISRKARKQNFLPSEIAILTEKVGKNLSVIQSKLTNGITNQKKNDIWIKIADAVNAVRPPKSAKLKWKSLHSQAKKEFIELAKIKFFFDCGTFVVCRRPLNKAVLLGNRGTRHIGNYSGNGGFIHTESVAYNLKEASTNVKPEGN